MRGYPTSNKRIIEDLEKLGFFFDDEGNMKYKSRDEKELRPIPKKPYRI